MFGVKDCTKGECHYLRRSVISTTVAKPSPGKEISLICCLLSKEVLWVISVSASILIGVISPCGDNDAKENVIF
jgi:hypothetical protein